MALVQFRLNRAIPEDGFDSSLDIFFGDEGIRLFFKQWSWGYWHGLKYGHYTYGFGPVGVMFWPAPKG